MPLARRTLRSRVDQHWQCMQHSHEQSDFQNAGIITLWTKTSSQICNLSRTASSGKSIFCDKSWSKSHGSPRAASTSGFLQVALSRVFRITFYASATFFFAGALPIEISWLMRNNPF
jgi:hypothetical protein